MPTVKFLWEEIRPYKNLRETYKHWSIWGVLQKFSQPKIPCEKNGRVKVPWHIEHPQSTFSLKSFFSTPHKSCHSRSDMFFITKIHHILINMEKQARVSRPKLGSKCNATDIQYSQLVLSGGVSNHPVQQSLGRSHHLLQVESVNRP